MSATVAISPADPTDFAASAVRVLPAPRSEPPTDSERASSGVDVPPAAAPLLPFDLAGAQLARSRRLAAEVVRHPARLVRPAIAVPGAAGLERTAPLDAQPSPARLATRRFLATCVEVIGGFRPIAQLRPLCFPERFADISQRLVAHPATGPGWRSRSPTAIGVRAAVRGARGAVRGMPGPPRTGRVQQTGPGDRVFVRRVQTCEVIDGVAEVAVVLARRDQVWAMALRMERRCDLWLCIHLEVL